MKLLCIVLYISHEMRFSTLDCILIDVLPVVCSTFSFTFVLQSLTVWIKPCVMLPLLKKWSTAQYVPIKCFICSVKPTLSHTWRVFILEPLIIWLTSQKWYFPMWRYQCHTNGTFLIYFTPLSTVYRILRIPVKTNAVQMWSTHI